MGERISHARPTEKRISQSTYINEDQKLTKEYHLNSNRKKEHYMLEQWRPEIDLKNITG